MKRYASLFLLSGLLLHANDIVIEDDFLKSLQEVSEIASKTKLNIDDMPALVTILHAQRLNMLGIQTLYEALTLVPGVELSMEASGAKQVIFRGVKEKGKVKLMVDGVTLNNTYRGSIYHYLDFPIDLIERIEIIRGPGSVLYGSNAISGVINIVTKHANARQSSALGGALGSEDNYRGSLYYHHTFAQNIRLFVDGYYQKSSTAIAGGPDKAGHLGKSDESLSDYSVGLSLEGSGVTFSSRVKASDAGMAFGLGNYFESSNDLDGNANMTMFAQLGYKGDLGEALSFDAKIGFNSYEQDISTRYLPHPSYGDLLYNSAYDEESYYADASLLYERLEAHEIVAGVRYEKIHALNSDFSNFFENNGQPYIPAEHTIKPDVSREIFSLYLNDQYHLGSSVDIALGLRWDNFSDFGNAFSPRLGMVWRSDETTNIKLMYSRSFRAPSWVELYSAIIGDPELNAETADTIELGIVKRLDADRTVRANLYVSRFENLIVREQAQYVQRGQSDYIGAEIEWRESFNANSELALNGSYNRAKDEIDNDIPNIARWLASATFTHTFLSGITSGTTVNYVSSRKRAADDTRESLEGYTLFDQSLGYRHNKLNLTASVKNLFDADYRYPAPAETFAQDYPRQGRTFWLNAKWEF